MNDMIKEHFALRVAEGPTDMQDMLWSVQRCRSVLMEGLGDDHVAQVINEDLRPWLFGPKCVLPTLISYVNKIEKGAPIVGADFLNFMWIAQRGEPLIAQTSRTVRGAPMPEIDVAWAGQTWVA